MSGKYGDETIEVEGGALWEIHKASRAGGGNGEADNAEYSRC